MSNEAQTWVLAYSDTTGADRMVMLVLAYHHNHVSGLCCPSLARLAQECGLDKKTVLAAIGRLERKGELDVERAALSYGKRGRGRVNRYSFPLLENGGNGGALDGPLPEEEWWNPTPGMVESEAEMVEPWGPPELTELVTELALSNPKERGNGFISIREALRSGRDNGTRA